MLLIKNKGNIVNRVGRLRRHRALAIIVAVVAIGVAIAGWIRHNDCTDWCVTQGAR